jgi:hypothetical protein
MKRVLTILFFATILVIFFQIQFENDNKIRDAAFKNLDLKLVGVVDTVDPVYNSYYHVGIIRLRIISSNIKEYDPRGTLDYFYCIIKNSHAEIYDHATRTLKGDTLIVNTESMITVCRRNETIIDSGSISLCSDKGYYDYILKHVSI